MKKIVLISISLITLSLVSCKKQLEQQPLTEKVLGNFFKTEAESEEYVNATYGALQSTGLYGLYLPVIGEIPSDNTFDEVPANDNGIFGQLDDFSVTALNALLSTNWRDSYVAIQRTNVVLNRINAISYKTASDKTSRVGEMKFIRALVYFNLVRTFGDVPLVIGETEDANSYFGQGRTPQAQVYSQIIADLNDAAQILPVTSTTQGRVTKGAAQCLLAKVYLTQNNQAAAKSILDAVYTSNTYTLLSKPADVFTAANENSKEIIFSVQFASGINGNTEGSTLFQQFSPSGTQSGAKGHNVPNVSMYSLYTASDLRKGVYVSLYSTSTVPYCSKYIKPTVITDGGSNFVVLRYADVLLMMAEVENYLGNLSTAQNYLNMVRNRAGLANTTAATKADLDDAIALERRLELIGEGHRWFDLIRGGNAVSIMNAWFVANGKTTVLDQNHLLMPVPQGQINTDPTISQNIGY